MSCKEPEKKPSAPTILGFKILDDFGEKIQFCICTLGIIVFYCEGSGHSFKCQKRSFIYKTSTAVFANHSAHVPITV